MGETILKMQGIQKYFSGVHALKGVNFELRAGEVHALMGENGAGKSTLIKVLCGIHKRDGGSVELFGEEVNFNNIAESQAAGISVILSNLFFAEQFAAGNILGGINWKGIVLAVILWLLTNVVKKTKKWHPIVFIGISALVGIIFQMG